MDHMEFKMRLDTGCEIHNLITSQVVEQLRITDAVIWEEEVLCTCLNGEQLLSTGFVVLRWKGKRFRKVFTTTFHVIDAGLLPWEVILGAETIQQHGILKFAGFGGAIPVLPKKKKGICLSSLTRPIDTDKNFSDERNTANSKKQDHKKKAAANDARVDADIKAKEDAARQRRSNTGDLNSGGSMSSR